MQSPYGVPVVTIKITLVNQDGAILVEGQAEVEVPL
jgi:hypothetical protein